MPTKNFYTKKLGQALAKDSRTIREATYHVMSGFRNTWQVVREGNRKPTRIFTTQLQALDFARQVARGKEGEIIVHSVTGDVSKVIKAA